MCPGLDYPLWVVFCLQSCGCFGEQVEAWMGLAAEEGECPWIQGGCGEVVIETSWGTGVIMAGSILQGTWEGIHC